MKNFVRGLILDLRNRCDVLLAEIEDEKVHHDLKEYAEKIRNRIDLTRGTLNNLLGRLESPSAAYSARNVFFDFKERSYEIQFHEYISVPSITRYQEPDKYFNRLLRLSCEQIGFPLALPVGSALGQSYYYSYPSQDIIFGPFLQVHSLLNLPDMFHEIGHIIYNNYKEFFEKPFNDVCSRYFSEQKEEAQRLKRGPGFITMISMLEDKWKGDWLGEFTCDIMGTYLVGKAYAWANFYLCAHTHSSDNVFLPGIDAFLATVHPSDESRMRAILLCLRNMIPTLSMDELVEEWGEYISALGVTKPDNYNFFYPDELIETLVQLVIKRCEEIGLISFIENHQGRHNPNIVETINTAWMEFRSNPDSYINWEKGNLEYVRKKLLRL